tara:strand:- start:2496 stop:3083 length:588 start_codon:yes stop_codon:yes gene_type:complete
MEFIAHRINKINDLKNLPKTIGIEVDLRDFNNKLVLQHDPFMDGEDFEDLLKNYNHGTLILNIKSERIEFRVLELIKKYNIEKYFFLDSTFPMVNYLINLGENNIALRFSEYEGIDTIINMRSKIRWIWVDCFSKLPIDKITYKLFKNNNFKLCLVSPDLQNQQEKINMYKEYLIKEQIYFDAICCKFTNINKWD